MQALINAVTALQLKWKRFFSSLNLNNYTLTPADIEVLNDGQNLGGKIDIVFAKIIPSKLNSKILSYAKDAIRERNDVMHDGKRTLEEDANIYVDSLEKVINAMAHG